MDGLTASFWDPRSLALTADSSTLFVGVRLRACSSVTEVVCGLVLASMTPVVA